MFNETLGKIHFWSMFVGVNITFFPMHFLGLSGMPRRIPDYPDAFAGWNLIASYGSMMSGASFLFFFYVIYRALVDKVVAGDDPWNSQEHGFGVSSLEWAFSSPPPAHTHEEVPVIKVND